VVGVKSFHGGAACVHVDIYNPTCVLYCVPFRKVQIIYHRNRNN
jgi:hypothetical protein